MAKTSKPARKKPASHASGKKSTLASKIRVSANGRKKSAVPLPSRVASAKRLSASLDSVPLLDLSRQYAAIEPEITAAVRRVCASQHYVLGAEVQEFEKAAAAFLGAKHAIGCASGTDAIWLSLVASGVNQSDDVFTTPFSFFATAGAILRAGARPVFVDVDPHTLNLDPAKLEARIRAYPTSHMKAVLPVHLFGQCVDMDSLDRVAAEYKLTVVEDAAQAFGASWRGRRAGALGRAAAFSFYPTKNLSCYGDGGLVSTNDDAVAERVRLLRNHGSPKRYYHDEVGWNSRLDALQAAILRVKLGYIEGWNRERNARADAYAMLFKASGLLAPRTAREAASAPVRLLDRHARAFHIYHQFVIRCDRRDELRAFLTKKKIGTEIYYPVPLHLQKCLGYLGYTSGDMPESERAAAEVLALPVFPELRVEEQATVVNAIAEFYS